MKETAQIPSPPQEVEALSSPPV